MTHMRHLHRLVAWQRRLLYGSGIVLLASGLGWLALHYGRAADALPSPLEASAMAVHGLAAFAALFVLGALAAQHIPNGWRLSHRMRWAQQRGSGIALCSLGAALALTGYLLYYFAPEAVRPALGWLHSALGVAAALLVLTHRRRASRQRDRTGAAGRTATDRTPEAPPADGNVARRGRK